MFHLILFFSLLGMKLKMNSKETVFGNDCQLIFGASEDLAVIKQENEDSIEINIEKNQNNLESVAVKEEIIDTLLPELSRKRSRDSKMPKPNCNHTLISVIFQKLKFHQKLEALLQSL